MKQRKEKPGHKASDAESVMKYYDEVLRFCVYQLGDADRAYDITQKTFLRFIMRADKLEDRRNIKGYLLTIARNLCADYWKSRKWDGTDCDAGESADTGGTGNAAYERVEDRMVLAALLSKLPPEQREVVVLRYYNDLKLKDISNLLSVNLSTVKTRLRLGVNTLRKYMEG